MFSGILCHGCHSANCKSGAHVLLMVTERAGESGVRVGVSGGRRDGRKKEPEWKHISGHASEEGFTQTETKDLCKQGVTELFIKKSSSPSSGHVWECGLEDVREWKEVCFKIKPCSQAALQPRVQLCQAVLAEACSLCLLCCDLAASPRCTAFVTSGAVSWGKKCWEWVRCVRECPKGLAGVQQWVWVTVPAW